MAEPAGLFVSYQVYFVAFDNRLQKLPIKSVPPLKLYTNEYFFSDLCVRNGNLVEGCNRGYY